MTLRKRFLHNQVRDFQISKQKFIIGSFFGLSYAVLIYSLLYIMREVFRWISISRDYDMWILTESEMNFYNLFFAFIAVIFAQSISISYWVSGPMQIRQRLELRKTSIINDQNVLNWTFAHWFAKFSLVFAVYFGIPWLKAYYVFSFFPDFNYFFILIIIVLFLQSWLNIRRVFKQQALKWMLVSAIIVSVLSFSLSRLNLIDSRQINNAVLSKSISYNYQLKLPESDNYNKLYKKSLIKDIHVVSAKEDLNNEAPIIIINHQEIAFEDLHMEIAKTLVNLDESDRHFVTYRLYIHSGIKMGYVNKLKQELARCGIDELAYATVPRKRIYDRKYYQNHAILANNHWYYINFWGTQDYYEEILDTNCLTRIHQISKDSFAINDVRIKKSLFKQEISILMSKNKNYPIKLIVDDDSDYSSYIFILSNFRDAVNELRDEYSQTVYGFKYIDLTYEEQSKIRLKYPSYFYEISEEMMKSMNK